MGHSLDSMLSSVREYQKQVRGVDFNRLMPSERVALLRNYALALVIEQAEFLDEANWKPWGYVIQKEVNREKALDEWCDMQVFLLDQALCMGFTATELSNAFEKVMIKNANRGDIKQ